MELEIEVPKLLKRHPSVTSVSLTGSRLSGRATKWSDWDFLVEAADFGAVSLALPELVAELKPLSCLWDPLSRHEIFMMILRGPVKVDIIFDRPHQPKPPWVVNYNNLAHVNSHFWDWILWIAGKEARGMTDIVTKELEKMYTYLLVPLGCTINPGSVEEAVKNYITVFQGQKKNLNIELNQTLEKEVIKGLNKMGFRV